MIVFSILGRHELLLQKSDCNVARRCQTANSSCNHNFLITHALNHKLHSSFVFVILLSTSIAPLSLRAYFSFTLYRSLLQNKYLIRGIFIFGSISLQFIRSFLFKAILSVINILLHIDFKLFFY